MSKTRQRTKPWTDDELALIERERQRWLAIGMSTEPADIPAIQKAWSDLYRRAGREPVFVWVTPGPLDSHAAMAIWSQTSLGDSLQASLGASLGDSLQDSLRASLWASLRDSLRASLGNSLWASLRDSLGNSLQASLRDSLQASLGNSHSLSYQSTWFWGAHDAYWIGWYRTAYQLGVPLTQEQDERLAEFERLALSGLWSWPHEHGIVVCDRPSVCAMEEWQPKTWRLHRSDGPALAFRDGYELYEWHGIRVPKAVIMEPQLLTVQQIQQETNAEVRRVMIERKGWEVWLTETGAQVVNVGSRGTLYRTELDGAQLAVAIVMNSTPEPDGTFKRYALRVPPEHQTVESAIASTFGLTAEQYQPVQET